MTFEVQGGASLTAGQPAGSAIEKMHANAHLPQLLGLMARYELTGGAALRGAAEAFFDELQSSHMFAVHWTSH